MYRKLWPAVQQLPTRSTHPVQDWWWKRIQRWPEKQSKSTESHSQWHHSSVQTNRETYYRLSVFNYNKTCFNYWLIFIMVSCAKKENEAYEISIFRKNKTIYRERKWEISETRVEALSNKWYETNSPSWCFFQALQTKAANLQALKLNN